MDDLNFTSPYAHIPGLSEGERETWMREGQSKKEEKEKNINYYPPIQHLLPQSNLWTERVHPVDESAFAIA